ARSRQMGGTGLGLSIVRHIVEAHGERVYARSELGVGSTFGFTLPVP
ncbi:MAG TPA: two-component sensor histidine kinase, partial [Candidatus Latescibacteria bacterium]|nr:two-component sensor histidine kinase [Candidatus Latescibacterota bacterium]